MQTLRYLAPNRIEVLANEAGHVTEYRPVYSRQLNVYRGIDNVLEFKLLNPDQKPLDVDRYTPKFVAFDENNTQVLSYEGVNLQEGDSTAYTKKGLFKVTVTENDLLNVKDQFLTYNVYLIDYDGTNVLTYANEWFDATGIINVKSHAFPGPAETKSVTTLAKLTSNATEWHSRDIIDAQPGVNGNEALHTAVVYTDGYEGDIVVQATLDDQVTDYTPWADVKQVAFTGAETEPTPINFNGVFSYIRFKSTADPTNKISKILVRN